jgi:N4-gp56 family major capsid protein
VANTTVSTAVRAKQWDSEFFKEYVRSNRFKKYMGQGENSIFQVKNDLTKKKGDAITINFVGALDADAGPNNGSTTLVGNEKALPNDGHKISVVVVRDATVVNLEEEQASAIDIRNAGRTALKTLAMRYLRNAIITALGSIHGVAYASATAAQRNTWQTANADRILYGNTASNKVAGDHAASLLNIAADEKLSRVVVSKLKRLAQDAENVNGDGIRPVTYGEDEETFVLFVGTRAFRDLKEDMATVHTDAEKRGKENPLFTGTTSLYWDGVVIREVPELPVLTGVGADPDGTGALPNGDVAPVYLCGAQALGVAWAQTTKTTLRKEDDYGFQRGVGFFEMRGVEKLLYGQGTSAAKDWGMVTGFVAAAADA